MLRFQLRLKPSVHPSAFSGQAVTRAYGVAWTIGGTAGEGLESGGEVFARALAAMGHLPTTQRDFPSRIRGGDTTFTVRLTPGGFLGPPEHVDLALAFNATVLPRMDAKLGAGSLLLVDEGVPAFVSTTGAEVQSFPFTELAKSAGSAKAKNMVALGASAALMGVDVQALTTQVGARFATKGDAVVASNVAALKAGHDEAASRFGLRFQAPDTSSDAAMFLSGNEAASLGALAAGCRFAAAYPITPASDVLEFLTPKLVEMGGVAIQMEDEIAALNACIGAGFSGAKSITATSGPGLALMTETLGLAGSTETPVVILDCQRPGPSTGMPTKHGQEDLWHLVHGGSGEFVRVVLAPTDVSDAFVATSEAFRLAEKFRCPSMVALDQQCSLFKQTIPAIDMDKEAQRHGVRAGPTAEAGSHAWDGTFAPYSDAGDAPMRVPLPGEPGGRYYSNSTEHAPSGFTNEDPKIRNAMVERRMVRMDAIVSDCQDPIVVEGQADADVVLVSWGSTVDACREAAARADVPVRVVGIRLLWPFPHDAVKEAFGDASQILCPEANAFGQLARLIRSELPVHDRLESVLRYDGTPVRATDMLTLIKEADA